MAVAVQKAGSPRPRKSFAGFLSLIRGAYGGQDSYLCQKALEHEYRTGYVTIEKGAEGSVWRPIQKAAMSVLSGGTGGYLLPMDFSDALLEVISEHCFIYPRANVIPMFSAELQAPRFDVETAPTANGVSPLFGGVQFRWGVERNPTQTEPTFRMNNYYAWDLMGDAVVSNQWLQDAGAIQSTEQSPRPEASQQLKAEHYLIRMFGQAAAWSAEWAFLRGAGTALQMPLGVVNSPARYLVARAGAGAIAIADVANMAARLLPRSWNTSVWACHPLAIAQLLQISSYQISHNPELPHDGRARPAGYLANLPLFVTDKLPPLGQRGDLVLFDPALYTVAQRMEVVVDVSPDVLFQTNQTVYRIWMRIDGKPALSGTVTLPDTSTVVSPYVVLEA